MGRSRKWPDNSMYRSRPWVSGLTNWGCWISKKPELPDQLARFVEKVGDPVSFSDVDTYVKLQNVRDQSHRVRTIVNAWKKQQEQERGMRGKYALALIIAMFVQGITINVIFLAIGFGKLT